jgi:hypothetical protein
VGLEVGTSASEKHVASILSPWYTNTCPHGVRIQKTTAKAQPFHSCSILLSINIRKEPVKCTAFFYGFILLPCPEEKQQIVLQKSYAALTVVVLFNVGYYSERKSYSKDKRPDISLSSLCFYLGLSSKHGLVTNRQKQMNLTVENPKPNF